MQLRVTCDAYLHHCGPEGARARWRYGHLDGRQRKLQNLRRDPRVAVSFEGTGENGIGMRDHLVLQGTARITEGGAAELLHTLAQTYVGPGTVFPPMADPPPGFVCHITVTRVGGSGPWT